MGNFKIGEKVVFKPIKDKDFFSWSDYCPIQENEIVTIKCYCNVYKNSVDIIEYPNTTFGQPLSINVRHFRKLDYEFSENLLTEISEAMKSETIKN